MKESSGQFLSVVIPTFNRRDTVLQTLDNLVQSGALAQCSVVVVDNGSDDGTYEAVEIYARNHEHVQGVRFDTNEGFAESFCRSFEVSDATYLLFLSDEDDLSSDNLSEILNILQTDQPNFLCPQMLVDGRVYRGRRKTEKFKARDSRTGAVYISGLVFHSAASRKWVNLVREYKANEVFAQFYPQVVLAFFLSLVGNALWMGRPVAVKREELPSSVSRQGNLPYWHRRSRIDQFESWIRLAPKFLSDSGITLSVQQRSEYFIERQLRFLEFANRFPERSKYRELDFDAVTLRLWLIVGLGRTKIKSFAKTVVRVLPAKWRESIGGLAAEHK